MLDLNTIKFIADFSPALAVGVVVALGIIIAILRFLGLAGIVGDKKKLVDDKQLNDVNGGVTEIKSTLTTIQNRLTAVEHEFKDRPNRQELHLVDINIERQNGRLGSIETELRAVRATVNRIDDFLLAISERSMRESTGRRSRED